MRLPNDEEVPGLEVTDDLLERHDHNVNFELRRRLVVSYSSVFSRISKVTHFFFRYFS